MPANPEFPHAQIPDIQETAEEFPETIQAVTGAKIVPKNFTAQVKDDKGTPLIQTPPPKVINTITPPADPAALAKTAKGSKGNSATWLAAFWLRIIKKALRFNWQVIGLNNDTHN
jgi:hypothetical protein